MNFPTPDTTTHDQEARTITYRWHTGRVVSDHDRIGERMLELSVHHSSQHKKYTANLHTLEVYPNGTRRTFVLADPERTTINSSVSIRTEPVARFARKALELFASRALTDLNASQDPDVAAFALVLTDAAPAPASPHGAPPLTVPKTSHDRGGPIDDQSTPAAMTPNPMLAALRQHARP